MVSFKFKGGFSAESGANPRTCRFKSQGLQHRIHANVAIKAFLGQTSLALSSLQQSGLQGSPPEDSAPSPGQGRFKGLLELQSNLFEVWLQKVFKATFTRIRQRVLS